MDIDLFPDRTEELCGGDFEIRKIWRLVGNAEIKRIQ